MILLIAGLDTGLGIMLPKAATECLLFTLSSLVGISWLLKEDSLFSFRASKGVEIFFFKSTDKKGSLVGETGVFTIFGSSIDDLGLYSLA